MAPDSYPISLDWCITLATTGLTLQTKPPSNFCLHV